ncbi:MAG: FlgD immunoglobulin-like domain containing protein [Candidatus Eisenbacteria bacterium]
MNALRATSIALLAACAVLVAAAPAHAYDEIIWRTLDCGGTASASGGGWTLGATIGQHDAGTLASGAFTLRGGFWIGGSPGALGVDDTATPLAFRFLPAWPNPVRADARVAFELPRASHAALSVFDVSGRVARRVDYGVLQPGRHERTWNADDEDGRPLPNGVYFLRLDTGRDHGVHRVVVVR